MVIPLSEKIRLPISKASLPKATLPKHTVQGGGYSVQNGKLPDIDSCFAVVLTRNVT
jgi:hypothetical protein